MVDFHSLLSAMYSATGTIENFANLLEKHFAEHPPQADLAEAFTELKDAGEDLDRLVGDSGWMPD